MEVVEEHRTVEAVLCEDCGKIHAANKCGEETYVNVPFSLIDMLLFSTALSFKDVSYISFYRLLIAKGIALIM